MYRSIKIRMIIAILIAFIGAIFANSFLNSQKRKVAIIVAAQNIPARTKLEKDYLKIMYINEEDKANFFPYAVVAEEDLIGAITKTDIKINSPIEKKPNIVVYDEETALALNYKGAVDNAYFIPEDKRVIAIEVDTSGGLNNKLNRGDYVDLIYTSTDEGKGGYFSNIITEHIPIFDIEKVNTDTNKLNKQQNILLLATPEECMKIAVAKRNGTIDLMLNPLNGEMGDNTPVNIKEFSVEEPTTKAEMIKGLEEYIEQQEISEDNKQSLLSNLNKEKSVEAIKNAITGSQISEDKQEKILRILNN